MSEHKLGDPRPLDVIEAAHAFRKTIPPDGHEGSCPWWLGDAIHKAYWAGLDAKRTPVEQAAPELLTACEEILGDLGFQVETDGDGWLDVCEEWTKRIRQLIAKAKELR